MVSGCLLVHYNIVAYYSNAMVHDLFGTGKLANWLLNYLAIMLLYITGRPVLPLVYTFSLSILDLQGHPYHSHLPSFILSGHTQSILAELRFNFHRCTRRLSFCRRNIIIYLNKNMQKWAILYLQNVLYIRIYCLCQFYMIWMQMELHRCVCVHPVTRWN